MIRNYRNLFLFIFSALFILSTEVKASALLAELSENEITIDARFNGKKILLFGARNNAGEIIVVVRGPKQDFKVSKKERVFGLWLNNQQTIFNDIYSHYSVYSSKPLAEIISGNIFRHLHIGLENIKMQSDGETNFYELGEFRNAIRTDFLKNNIYQENTNQVTLLNDTLFKTTIEFPKKLPIGKNLVEIYLVKDGRIISMQSKPIEAYKVGFEALIFDFAHQSPLAYGILAVLFSLFFGWFANIIFWKV